MEDEEQVHFEQAGQEPTGVEAVELDMPQQQSEPQAALAPQECEPERSKPQLEDRFDSNYRYVMVAARRARQLQNGSPPLVSSRSTKACRVAQDEIAAGAVKYVRTGKAGRAEKRAPASLVNTFQS